MKIYLIGGAVRDKIRNSPINDYDYVVIGSSIKEMLDAGFIQVGCSFPVFLHPITHNEYALARREVKVGNKHTDFTFTFDKDITLEEDIQRRDFTCNAIAYDEDKQQFIDFVGGIGDIKHKILRHVNSLHFPEDPLRILRMCRFSAQLNFDVAPETLELCRQMVKNNLLENLSPERIWKEFERALNTDNFINFILFANACGALQFILPELCNIPQIKEQSFPYVFSASDSSIFALFHHARNTSPMVKFALLFLSIYLFSSNISTNNIKQIIKSFSKHFRIPKSYENFANSAFSFYNSIKDNLFPNTEDLLNLISDASNSFHNKEKLHNILSFCLCDFLRYNLNKEKMLEFNNLQSRCCKIFSIVSNLHASDMPNYNLLPKNSQFKQIYRNFILHTLSDNNL